MAHQIWLHAWRMAALPRGGGRDVLDGDELEPASALRLVHERLGLLDVERVVEQRRVYVVHAHGPFLLSTHAATVDHRPSGGDGVVDVQEAFGRAPHGGG